MEPCNRKELRMMGWAFLGLLIAIAIFVVFCGVAPVIQAVAR